MNLLSGRRDPAKLLAPAAPSTHSRVPWQPPYGTLGPGVAVLKMTKKKIIFHEEFLPLLIVTDVTII